MMDPSNVSQYLTFIVSPSSHLPNIQSQLNLDTISNSNEESRKSSTSCLSTSFHPEAEDAQLWIPVGSIKRTRVSVNKCHVCRKEFKTTGALRTHILIHRQDKVHICDICQKAFSQYNQLTSHMMTHHKRKTYDCTQSDCHKTHDDKHSLKHPSASQHGEHLKSSFTTSNASKYDLPSSPWKPTVNHVSDYHGLFVSHRKPVSAPVFKAPFYSGKLFSSHDTGELGLGCYKEDTYSSEVNYSAQQKSWTLFTMDESHKVKERTRMSTFTHWTLVNEIAEDPVVLQNPFNVKGLETSLDLPKSYPEERKRVLSFQPNKEATTSSMGVCTKSQASICPNQDCPILVKHNLKETKSSNKLKRRHSSSSFNPSAFCSDCNLPGPAFPSSPASLPSKSSPSHPLSVPQPTSRSQSPSPVVLPSFNTFPGNPFLQKETVVKSAGEEPNSSRRTYKRTSSSCKAQAKPLCSQETLAFERMEERDSQSSSSTLDGQKGASKHKGKSKGTNLSPLIIPVSVPVPAPNTLVLQTSTQQARRSQACKGTPKRSHHLDHLKCLIIPSPPPTHSSTPQCTQGSARCCGTGGFPSQLRSPAYPGDQPLSPRPYTPQPMLSPLRPGTGLYSKSLPQYEPCPSLPNTPSFLVDNTIVNIQPRINIGSQFQAEVPSVRDTFYLLYEEHPAQLVWTPWKDLPTNTETQQRVTELIDLCCSSVLPGGGTNIELALHCLHEVQGNITAALDLLLMREDFRTSWHPLRDYHYTGSDHWTAQEMKLFKKALEDYDKDFRQICNVVQTKSIAQCVEYYYNKKQLKKFKQRGRAVNKKDRGGGGGNFIFFNTKTFKGSQPHQPEQTEETQAAEDPLCARDVKSLRSPSVRTATNSR